MLSWFLLMYSTLLGFHSTSAFVVEPVSDISACHEVKKQSCKLRIVEEMVPKLKEICWIQNKYYEYHIEDNF